jgi:hypothetical protein
MKTPDEIKKGLECYFRSENYLCGPICIGRECDLYTGNYSVTENVKDALAYIQQLEEMQYNFVEALRCIVFYDGHAEWLMNLAAELEKTDGVTACPFDAPQWHSEKHVIWMILAGMFGDWGTSIRGGWIDQTGEAAKFIRSICDEEVEGC